MGKFLIAARPASTMKMESTAAKIGRSMKKRENMALLLRLRFCLGFRLRLRLRLRLGDAHRRAGPQAHQALDDHAVARLYAVVDHPAVARPVADLDRARFSLAFFIDDINKFSLGTFEDGALRHRKRVGA